jgi:TRAP-type C4-dicarboxylate transport system permease small subunit
MAEQIARWVLSLLIGLVAIAQFVQVFTRYVLQTPVMGLEEATMFPSLWLFMLGAANASRENSQIRANVLEIFIKTEAGHARLGVVTEIVSLAVSTWLAWWAWDFTRYSWRTWRESATLYWPTFWADIALFTGLALVIAFTLRTLIDHLRVLTRDRERRHG